MDIGYFTDKNHRPESSEISDIIGFKLPVWEDFVNFIRVNYTPQVDFKFQYGKKYGWAMRFQLKGKLFTSLYPALNGFTVQIILNPEAIKKVQKLKLSKNIQQSIDRATPYPEGRWLFIPAESEKDIKDIKRFLKLRYEMLCQVK